MTCIVAMVHENEVFMAGDLMGSNGFTKKVYPDPKVFKNGDFVIGYTSSFRMGQLLQYNWEQPPRIEGLTDRQYLQVDVIESMRGVFNAYGYGSNEGLEDIGGNFLIGYKGVLYEMQQNFSILKHEDFAAIGSGQDYANSVLSVLETSVVKTEDVVQCLGTAIKTAARFTTSVSEEFTWESTYVPTEQEMEDFLWVENNRIVDETLEELPISDADKEAFLRVRDMLDNTLSEPTEDSVENQVSQMLNDIMKDEIPEQLSVEVLKHDSPEVLGTLWYQMEEGKTAGLEFGYTEADGSSGATLVDAEYLDSNDRKELIFLLKEITGKDLSRNSTDNLIKRFISTMISYIPENR